jgi:hypoxanthine phosphoribosyltransferase
MSSSALVASPKHASIREVVYDEAAIRRRVAGLADEISRDYAGSDLAVVGILKGAYLFACDLVRALSVPCVLDFVSISRYRRVPSQREVRITSDLEIDPRGRDLLIVEDIVDTGLTLHYLIDVLRRREPRSVGICSLLDRPNLRLAEIPVRYVGFDVNDDFLVGYGLDYRERFRNLPFIATLEL